MYYLIQQFSLMTLIILLPSLQCSVFVLMEKLFRKFRVLVNFIWRKFYFGHFQVFNSTTVE